MTSRVSPSPSTLAQPSGSATKPIPTTPAIAIPQPRQTLDAAADSNSVLTSSSPVYSRAHPFLRKFQSTVHKVIAQQKQAASAMGSSAFSTSSSTLSESSSDDDKRVDEAIKSATAQPIRTKSPTTAAANATDAILNRRISHMNLDKVNESAKASKTGSGCSCSSHRFTSDDDSDDDIRVEPAQFPPISDEARRFSDTLLGQNKAWAIKKEQERPGFFARLEDQQKPQVLWIGCSDSRVPANQIVNLDPGEIFVHRNIANIVTHTDMNLLSVLEYAVDVLKVRHIIICGHYGCGGVAASLTQKQFGIIDNWLRNIKDLYTIHRKKFDTLPRGGKEQQDLLTELNVIQSALNVSHTSIIQRAWSRGENLSVHGWCYRLSDGVIRNLGLCIEGPGNVEEVYHVMEEVKSSR
ncbi:hypothetical protein BG011_000485 [Mortierella polycephala]|uniref:Carbonic anhydrase n=1 Tax=Mortierella polycephala TaxID=41804 RepID=A0A9P6UAS6_9FUNG|nr:hypothetical protein BG011_000485 [Mortierella polycephala]